MKISVDCYMAKRMMVDWNRDYYSINGLDAILEYYDEFDENAEFDVIGICCDCTEYGEHGAAYDMDTMIHEYSFVLDSEEWMQENRENGLFDDDDKFEDVSDMFVEDLVEALEEHTTVLHVSNGNYIVFAF